jgi:hypothetical protein
MSAPNALRSQAQRLRGALPPRRQATPPAEQGRRLATIPRPKDDAEIRLNWCEYDGHPYLSIRVWVKDDAGEWWPDKHRGFSVRLRELPDVADAIAQAAELAADHLEGRQGGIDRHAPPPGHRPADPGRRADGVESGQFDEFQGGQAY